MEDIFAMVRRSGRGCHILKWDLKDAFRMIPVAAEQRWLLGFTWDGNTYQENCLPFGLATAPYIFNLFAEGLHWILQSFWGWQELAHYLDDFITTVRCDEAPLRVPNTQHQFATTLDYLGLARQPTKDMAGTTVDTLGIEIDTVAMVARLPDKKRNKARAAVSEALSKGHLTLLDT